MEEKQSYPRIPTASWWALRNQFIKTLPSTVTVSYLKSLLNYNTDKAAQSLIPQLKQVGLIDEDGKPTPRANDWRSDIKYKETCEAILNEIYPNELLELFPGPDFDKNAIIQWFMHTASVGEGTAKIYATEFILLNEGTPSNEEEQVKKEKVKRKLKKKAQDDNNSNNNNVNESKQIEAIIQPATAKEQNSNFSSSIHIDLQIHISPEASNEQIESIFYNISKYLK